MLFFGSLTGPVMAYFLAESYTRTRDVKRYSRRLFLFSLISWPFYSLFLLRQWPSVYFSVLTTLWLGLQAIRIWDSGEIPGWAKALLISGLCLLSIFCDWPVYNVLLPLLMFIFRDRPEAKWRAFALLTLSYAVFMIMLNGNIRASWYQFGMLLPYFLLRFGFSGEPGSKHPFHKWFFYVFYPLQFALLVAAGGHVY